MGNKLRRNKVAITGRAVVFVIITLFGVFMALPLFYSLLQSVKPYNELFIYPPRFWVKSPTMDNFRDLFLVTSNSWVPFSRYIFNTLLVTICCCVLHILAASMAAYPMSLMEFPGRKVLSNIVVWSLLFNSGVTGLPNYIIMAKLGLIDNYFGLIIPAIGSSFGFYLMQNFMGELPKEMLEAARIDGANEFYIMWHVALPNVKPAWMTLAIFTFQGSWNATGGMITYTETIKLLPTALGQIMAAGYARVGASAASAVIMMIPPIIFFIFAQSNTIKTMAHAGIKG